MSLFTDPFPLSKRLPEIRFRPDPATEEQAPAPCLPGARLADEARDAFPRRPAGRNMPSALA